MHAATCLCPATGPRPTVPSANPRHSAHQPKLACMASSPGRCVCATLIHVLASCIAPLAPQAQPKVKAKRSLAEPSSCRERWGGRAPQRSADQRLGACAAASEHSYGVGTGSAVAEPPQDGLLFSRGSPGCAETQTCKHPIEPDTDPPASLVLPQPRYQQCRLRLGRHRLQTSVSPVSLRQPHVCCCHREPLPVC